MVSKTNNYFSRGFGSLATKAKTSLVALALAAGCGPSYQKPAFEFDKVGVIPLPSQASNADKRGFADFNNDGLTDMVEVNDEAWVGQKWEMKLYAGTKGEDGLIHFKDPVTLELPLKGKWTASKTKLDTADVNGDGFADVVISQYKEGILKDTYTLGFALNQGDGNFVFQRDISKEKVPFGEALVRLVDQFDDSQGNKSLSFYLQLDWADMNGDGKDDFVFFWKQKNGVYVETWYSSSSGNTISFDDWSNTNVDSIMYGVGSKGAKRIDVEDLTGDNKADILVYDPKVGDGIDISTGENLSSGKSLKFASRAPARLTEIEMNPAGFEKRDSFDINLDGCADYIHAGRQGIKPSISYILRKCG